MCEPVSITLGALSLGSSVAGALAGHAAQNKAAKAQDQANSQYQQGVTTAANNSAAFQNQQIDQQLAQEELATEQTIQALSLRRSQERTAAKRSVLDVTRQAQMADATARVSSGASGVAGASVTAILHDVEGQAGLASKSVLDNASMVDQQLAMQTDATRQNMAVERDNLALSRKGVEVDRQNRIAGVQNLPTQPRANPFATALQIVGAGIDFATTLNGVRKPKGT